MKKKIVIAAFSAAFLILLFSQAIRSAIHNKFYFVTASSIWAVSPDNLKVKQIRDIKSDSYASVIRDGNSLYVLTTDDKVQRILYEINGSGAILRTVATAAKTPLLKELQYGILSCHDNFLYGVIFRGEHSTYDLVRVSLKTGKAELVVESMEISSPGGNPFSFSGDWLYACGNHGRGALFWEPYLICYNLRTGEKQELLFDAITQDYSDYPFLDGADFYFPFKKEKSDGEPEYVLHHYVMNGSEIRYEEEIRLYEGADYKKLTLNGMSDSPVFAIHDGMILFGGEDGYLYERKKNGKVTRLWYAKEMNSFYSSVFSFGHNGYLCYTDGLLQEGEGTLYYRNLKKNHWTQADFTAD